MKNICFFNSIIFWGGGEKLHLENAIEFSKKSYNVSLLAHPKSPLWAKANSEGLKTFPVIAGNLSFLNPFKIVKLMQFYRKEKIDTVIFTTSQDLKLGSISAKLAGVEKIVYLRGLAVPVKASIINRIVFKYLLTHIISNSDETKRNILKHLGKHINEEKVHTIYHGVSVNNSGKDKNHRLKEIQEKGHGVILGNAGRLTSQKGHNKLIEIAKNLKNQQIDFTLFIAGTGDLESELQELIDQYNLQKEVILLGFVSDMEGFMNSLDIFLLSSIWEGFGFVIVEAMLRELPVVAFDISSNPEIVTADKTGFLVDYPDVEGFAQKTLQLINDEALRDKMGKAGLKSVFERFVIEDIITELESYILGEAKAI
jgi:glycosyltransferase involved in cell wall biosynthesis